MKSTFWKAATAVLAMGLSLGIVAQTKLPGPPSTAGPLSVPVTGTQDPAEKPSSHHPTPHATHPAKAHTNQHLPQAHHTSKPPQAPSTPAHTPPKSPKHSDSATDHKQ